MGTATPGKSSSTVRAKTASAGKASTPRAAQKAPDPVAFFAAMERAIPSPKCELDFDNPWQLLIATILSAQSTDKMINKVTPVLFARWPTPALLAESDIEELEAVVKPTGFFHNKAKAIREASRLLVENFGGQVPRTIAEITTLPGAARKTANVVLGTAYNLPAGIPIDTHAGRLARRFLYSDEQDPVKVESDLCATFPKEQWINLGHRLVLHGRYICVAKKPACTACPINELCPSRESEPVGSIDERAAREWRIVQSRGAVAE